MQYTTNFNLKEPQYADEADVAILNDNFETIDTVMHQNRLMLAEPFDQTKAYSAGKMVVYEGASYKFKVDHAAGNWNASQVEQMPIADGASGGGVVTKTATGNPIELTDAASAPLVRCETAITGSQDLHGYDKPWVGGSGKNKLPLVLSDIKNTQSPATSQGSWSGDSYVTNGVTFKINTDNDGNVTSILATGSATSDNATLVLYGTNVTSAKDIVFSQPFIVSDGANGSATTFRGIVWGTEGAFIDAEEVSFNAMTVYGFGIRIMAGYTLPSGGVTFYPMIRLSTESDSTFTPYSNICPITAYTEGEIEVSDGDGNTTTHTTTYPSAIYRGSEDVVNGGVTSEQIKVVFDGSVDETWGFNSDVPQFFITLPTGYSSSNAISNIFECKYSTTPGVYIITTSDKLLRVKLTADFMTEHSISDVSSWKTWLSNNNLEVVCSANTTSSVTPTNLPIRTLSGYNHIESTTGDMEIEYITEEYQPIIDLEPEIEANPADAPTQTLTSIKINGITYSLPSGGGGGEVVRASNTITVSGGVS